MKNKENLYASVAASCLLLSACNWVDSAGNEGVEVPVTEIFLDDQAVGDATLLQEKSIGLFKTVRDTSAALEQTFTWSDTPLEQGALSSCANLPDVDMALAASSLSEACTDTDNCALDFERIEAEDEVAEFRLQVPELRASVGLRYQLTVTDSGGRENTRDFDLCLIAINEAPLAVNDTFVVLEGVRAAFTVDGLNLLSNDSDDEDVSNAEFRILTEPLVAPKSAAYFELGDDGSFVYESSLSQIQADELDSFVYQLSDGIHLSSATATVRVAALNQAPEQLSVLPELSAMEGEDFLQNLGLYFADPEGSDLSFTLAAGTPLPDAGTLALSAAGVLSGIPAAADVGSHVLTLIVSDGGASLEVDITLLIEVAPIVVTNSAPQYVEDSVFSQIVQLGSAIQPVIPEFTDSDGDRLVYAIRVGRVLPDGVEIDPDTGIVSGIPTEEVIVRSLRIEATDSFGETAISEAFYIWVQ